MELRDRKFHSRRESEPSSLGEMTDILDDDHFDDDADKAIRACIDLANPRSFFLYAGAGSGKTRSLVKALRHTSRYQGRRLALRNQQIAVITYTNAACDEIKQRLEFDPLIVVRTIHSFAWSLIRGFNNDIRGWLTKNLSVEIAELRDAQAKGRAGTKAAARRDRSIKSKRHRIERLDGIRHFTYSPSGDNRTADSLTHTEIIRMTAKFLTKKPGLQKLLVARYPVLLIDESQDTNRFLMDAILHIEKEYRDRFCVGLFGDTMQRIYGDGKSGLSDAIPASWSRPKKRMNHRSCLRVINLINKIRENVDGQEQRGRSDIPKGYVRLFILPEDTADKCAAEAQVAKRMGQITGDNGWASDGKQIKTLTLEHHMAARRFGFESFFNNLYQIERTRTELLEGSEPGVAFFTRDVLPVVLAMRTNDRFLMAAHVRRHSPLLSLERLQNESNNQITLLRSAKAGTESLYALFSAEGDPTLLEVLRNVAQTGLFDVPDILKPFVEDSGSDTHQESDREGQHGGTGGHEKDSAQSLWRLALDTPFNQVEKYHSYVCGKSEFDTHQGIKGLEFSRVMVVIGDGEARGFMFSFEKLFGARSKSRSDRTNEDEGKETSIDRTIRLFYVTCSRAKNGLAVVNYTARPDLVKSELVTRGWFREDEIELLEFD